MNYARHVSTRVTPQSEPIPGSTQVENNAGGFTWTVDKWSRLDRFLILGAEGGTYYVTERKLTRDNATAIQECLVEDGPRTVARIVEISDSGRAPKNDPAIFALALAATSDDLWTKSLALTALPKVCRIGTHLFHFAQMRQELRGWNRSLRDAVSAWYQRPVDDVAYQAVKYQQRDGWTHRDLLRLAHPKPPTPAHNALYSWITTGKLSLTDSPAIVEGMELLKSATTAGHVVRLIGEYDLPREAVEAADTKWLKEPAVWEALLVDMPLGALVRSLARMTAIGLVAPLSEASRYIVGRLADVDGIHRSRLHPIALLSALQVYASGKGIKGSLTWDPVGPIIDALDTAFYEAFQNVPTTGKAFVLGLDVSGSMGVEVAGIPGLTARDVTAALALVTARREPNHAILGFSTTLVPLAISPKQRLADVIAVINRMPFGGTDCSLPMVWATKSQVKVDGFVVLTDNETWAGAIHPAQALKQYRQTMGVNARSVVVGMTATGFTIADPNDPGMLDVVGCDTATPGLIGDFVAGGL